MLHVQEALRSGTTLEQIVDTYGLKIARGKHYANLVSFHYNMIRADWSERINHECRGLVLDANNNWNVVARGFDKFFGYGEPNAAEIDWATVRVQEKLDGTMCLIYWYDYAWRVATTGSPDASGMVGTERYTFADLFWSTFHAQGLKREYFVHKNFTYIFELCTPQSRIVVNHTTSFVTLIGVRDLNGKEYPVNAFSYPLPVVKEFPLNSFDAIVSSFKEMNPLQQEGYVVVDGQFNRVKMKHPTYVALHHLNGEVTDRRLLEVALTGETPELLNAFPEFSDRLWAMQNKIDVAALVIDTDYANLRTIDDKKQFALAAQRTQYPHGLFSIRNGKAKNGHEFLANTPIDNCIKMLGV